jgi:hypothetical protein
MTSLDIPWDTRISGRVAYLEACAAAAWQICHGGGDMSCLYPPENCSSQLKQTRGFSRRTLDIIAASG